MSRTAVSVSHITDNHKEKEGERMCRILLLVTVAWSNCMSLFFFPLLSTMTMVSLKKKKKKNSTKRLEC